MPRPTAPQTLAETLEEDRAAGAQAATLVLITPDFADPRLAAFLEEWQMRGGQHFGLALDADSFRAGRVGLPDSFGGPTVRVVRRGDDLQAVLEGSDDGWSGS